MSYLVGEVAYCGKCGKRKQPRGRSAPMEMASSLCDWECAGYSQPPDPGDLWPGETREEFGYPKPPSGIRGAQE